MFISSTLTFSYTLSGPSLDNVQTVHIESRGTLEFPTFQTESEFEMTLEPLVMTPGAPHDLDERVQTIPTFVSLSGNFTDGEGTSFEGLFSLEIRAADLQRAADSGFAPTTITFNGSVQTPTYDAIQLRTSIDWVAKEKLESTVNYSRGSATLSGGADITLGDNLLVKLTLTNEAGLVTTLRHGANGSATGTIMKGNKKLADVTASMEGIVIEYTDGTFETLG